MVVTCEICRGTGILLEESCPNCGGDGEVDLLDDSFKHTSHSQHRILQGNIWSIVLTAVADIEGKIDDVKEKVDEIKAVVDEL